MPRWLISLSAERNLVAYRLTLRWNGSFKIKPAPLPFGQACILVVESNLPFRRKLQRFPDSANARRALLQAAANEFPLPPAEMLYGLGIQGNDGYMYALPLEVIDDVRARNLRPVIALVAGEALDAEGCLVAFESYLRYGPEVDLLRRGRFVSRRRLLQIQLGGALAVGLIAVGVMVVSPDLIANLLERRVSALRQQAGSLPAVYRASEKMAYAQAEAARLFARPEARFPGMLTRLFDTVAPGHSIRTVELKDGVLRITGTGVDVREWLIDNGFPPERISVESMGSYQRFRAERAL